MSLLNTTLSNIDSSETRFHELRTTADSLIGNRNQDEKKKDTLQDDVVTFSSPADNQHQSLDCFSSSRSKAMQAYKNFSSNASVADTAKSVEDSQKVTGSDEDEDKKSNDPLKKSDDKSTKSTEENDKKPNGEEMTDEEQQKVSSMKERDTEVKTHEKAHQSAGGQYAGAPQYEYEKGPDGKSYVTDGHVNIDVSKESTADATISKMKTVIKAAHAPAQPSGQDLKVASQAQQTLNEAQAEKSKEAAKTTDDSDSAKGSSKNSTQSSETSDSKVDNELPKKSLSN